MRRALAALVLVLAACQPAVEPPHLQYEKDALSIDNPFPDLRLMQSGAFTVRDNWYVPFLPARATTRQMKQLLGGYARALVTVEGVGNFGPTLLPVSTRVDRTSLAGTMARLVKTPGGWEVLEAEVAVGSSRDILLEEGQEVPADYPEFVIARPSVILPDGAEGMLVVKVGLQTEGGERFGRGFGVEADPEARARAKTAAAVLGLAEGEVLLALPLRAAPVKARFEKLAAWAEGLAAPPQVTIGAHGLEAVENSQRPDGVWAAGDPDFSTLNPWLEKRSWATPADAVGKVVLGSVLARDLREDGVWNEAWVNDPDSAPAVPLRFVLSVPKGPRPAGGWPVAVVGHGMNSRNTPLLNNPDAVCLELAQVLAKAGIACAGIDAPSHGSRGNPFEFFGLENLARSRENFRQMVVDQMQLVRALPTIDVDGDGQGDFQREVGYWGNSLGSIMGASLVSVDPRVRAAVLNVPGGGLSNILTGDEIRDRIGLILVAETNLTFQSPEYYASFPFFRAVAQLVIDPGDPVNVGQLLPGSGRAVLAQEGLGDVTIPNFTTEDLAGAMRLTPVTTPQSGAGLQVLFRADPTAYLSASKARDYNGHGLMWEAETDTLRAQATRFLVTRGAEFHPEGLPAQ
jgi:hypothetical protein